MEAVVAGAVVAAVPVVAVDAVVAGVAAVLVVVGVPGSKRCHQYNECGDPGVLDSEPEVTYAKANF